MIHPPRSWQPLGMDHPWPPPDGGEVHLWRVRNTAELDRTTWLAPLWGVLDEQEKAKADRFRAAHARRASILARGMTRLVLAKYLATSARSLTFEFNQYGKPALAERALAERLQFNVSHSGDWVVLAVTSAAAVGVDIERHRPLDDALRLAERFFSLSERSTLAQIASAEQLAAFFRCWTRKEAYIKAVGTGIFAGLDTFDVTLRPEEPANVLRFHTTAYNPGAWTLCDFDLAERYSAAVMVHAPSPVLRFNDFVPPEPRADH